MAFNLISLIICTRNRCEKLSKCLESLQCIVVPFLWETIVVDNGSSDVTHAVVDQFASGAHFAVKYVFEPQPGLSRARNKGVSVASGDLILFTDDDCYPLPNFLAEAAVVFKDPKISFIGGRVLLHDPDDYPITITTSMAQKVLHPYSFVPAGFIHGANMGFRRELFEEIGGFDESLGAGTALACGEDTEFIGRASAKGYLGGYFPGPSVRHHHGRKAHEANALTRGYDLGRGAYYAAMLLQPTVRILYLKRWWSSFSWEGRRELFRELYGAIAYFLTVANNRFHQKVTVPHFAAKFTHNQ